jgi:hypothetical protein
VSNNLATLNVKLATALRDSDYATWATGEIDDLLTYGLAFLFPHLSREIAPSSAEITLVTDTFFYNLPSGVMHVSRVDWVDTDDNEHGPVGGGSWEVVGSPILGTGQLHISPVIANQGGTLRLLSYGRFDLTTNLIPDDYVSYLLAVSRAEAYRRMAGSRARFEAWQAANQKQNVTVNELILLINEADAEAERLRRHIRVWHKPVPGRVG